MSYTRILTRLTNTPLLIAEHKLAVISEQVLLALLAGDKPANSAPSMSGATQPSYNTQEVVASANSPTRKLGIIKVYDSLVARGGSAFSGLTSYESLKSQTENLIRTGATDIGFDIDSPGGESVALFALTTYFRALPARGIKTFTFVSGMATSAAYGIAASTGTIYSAELSYTASIAAIMTHLSLQSKHEKEGKQYTLIRSKPKKALGDPYTNLSKELVAKFQADIMVVDKIFNRDVLASRPDIGIKTIKDLEGQSLPSEKALSLGIIDEIAVDFEDALNKHLNKKPNKQSQNKGNARKERASTDASTNATNLALQTQEVNMTEEVEETKPAETTKVADTAKAPATTATEATGVSTATGTSPVTAADNASVDVKAAVQQALSEERTRVAGISAFAKTLGLSDSIASGLSAKGYELDAAKDMMTFMAENTDKNTSVDTSTGAGNTVNVDTALTADAEEDGEKVNMLASFCSATGRKPVASAATDGEA